MDLPWWARSPGPFTVSQWVILTLVGFYMLRKRVYDQKPMFNRFFDAMWSLGRIVLLSDLVWVIVCFLRFGSQFPSSVPQLAFSGLRDLGGVIFCHINLKKKPPLFDRDLNWMWVVDIAFMLIWFFTAPNPAYTDWTYAIRYDYPWGTVWATFFISHILGRIITSSIYLVGLRNGIMGVNR